MPGSGMGWECFGDGVAGYAQTPLAAYGAWMENKWARFLNIFTGGGR